MEADTPAREILITGATGLVGPPLVRVLRDAGHRVTTLARGDNHAAPSWSPTRGELRLGDTPLPEVVIHLAGENIAARRWGAAQRRRLVESRETGTRVLIRGLRQAGARPRLMLFASAVGWYGDRGDEPLDETAAPGGGVPSEICARLEAAADEARSISQRVVPMRVGIVLSPEGGALGRMLLPFRLGLGGRIGHGRQYMSWIAMADLLAGIRHLVERSSLDGPVNLTAPNPVANAEFVVALGRALHRPAVLPMPAFAVRLLFGRMGEELLLAGARVLPERLLSDGYRFAEPAIDGALDRLL